ncbi:MAG: DUF6328 family protein [Acidimicrobiales bacterium]|jgi:hypothetical protein|nr:DUF6328 family protein [Acidimicrobiales bacterium]
MTDRADADAYGDMSAHQLVEEHHQEELRQRYYGLLQELRVLLPGVQVLVGFLLTVPFALGFEELDTTGRRLYGVALGSGLMAVISFVSPTVFHRVGGRTLRAERLVMGIRSTRAGLAFLALALLSGSLLVTRFVFDTAVAVVFVGAIALAMAVFWVVIPLRASRHRHLPPASTRPDRDDQG